jgi:hypothetical protein
MNEHVVAQQDARGSLQIAAAPSKRPKASFPFFFIAFKTRGHFLLVKLNLQSPVAIPWGNP